MAVTTEALLADHPDVLTMVAESEAELASIYPPEVRYAFSPQQLLDSGVRMIVAREDGQLLGCGGVAHYDGFAELKRIFTTKAARGKGVGRIIVAALEDMARDAGFRVMRLETGEASPDALALYDRCGYARRGVFGEYEENGSSVFMEKAL